MIKLIEILKKVKICQLIRATTDLKKKLILELTKPDYAIQSSKQTFGSQ